MRATFGFIGILMVLGIGYLVYSTQIQSGPGGEPLPQLKNLTAVRRDLLSLGQAERLFLATNGSYATLEQLKSSGVVSVVPEGGGWGYDYEIETDGADDFLITARPRNPGLDLPTLTIDKRMQMAP